MSKKLTSAVLTATGVLFTQNMGDHSAISVQVLSAGTGCTIVYEVSNDKTTWFPASGRSANASDPRPVKQTTAADLIVFPKTAHWFRARVSVYGSGNVQVAAEASEHVPAYFRDPNPADDWNYVAATGGITDNTAVALVAAAGAGIRNYLDSIEIINRHATVATEVEIRDGATAIWRQEFPAAMLYPAVIRFPKGVLKSSANAALNVCAVTTGTKTYVNARGYKAE